MQIIQVQENQKNEWNKFIASNSCGNFLQSFEWGEFQKSLGRKIWRLAILEKSNSDLESDIRECRFLSAVIIKHNLPFGKSYLYCPRGPIIKKLKIKNEKLKINVIRKRHSRMSLSEQNKKVFELLFKEIEKIAEKEKAVFFRIEPPFLENENDFELLFKNNKSLISAKSIQPKDTLILDIRKSGEELLKEMKQKTRYNIRLAEKRGVKIISNIELPASHNSRKGLRLEKFWELLQKTSQRDKFHTHSKEYYQKMLEAFPASLDSDIFPQAELFFAEYEGEIIAANLVMFFNKTAVYLHGASSDKFRSVMAPYLLHWEQIREVKKRGCEYYDFWGISPAQIPFRNCGEQENKKHALESHRGSKIFKEEKNWQGITRFKKGFGGEEISYAGAFDLIYQPIIYKLYNFAKYLRR